MGGEPEWGTVRASSDLVSGGGSSGTHAVFMCECVVCAKTGVVGQALGWAGHCRPQILKFVFWY